MAKITGVGLLCSSFSRLAPCPCYVLAQSLVGICHCSNFPRTEHYTQKQVDTVIQACAFILASESSEFVVL